MNDLLECPNCMTPCIDLHDYRSMIMVSPDYALFTVRCPACGEVVSSMHAIPGNMQEEVMYAAAQVGAGMGHQR